RRAYPLVLAIADDDDAGRPLTPHDLHELVAVDAGVHRRGGQIVAGREHQLLGAHRQDDDAVGGVVSHHVRDRGENVSGFPQAQRWSVRPSTRHEGEPARTGECAEPLDSNLWITADRKSTRLNSSHVKISY